MDDVFERFTMTILTMSKLVQKIKSLEMHKFGLKAVHVMCLYHLRARPEGLTASELCRRTLDDKAAISRAVVRSMEPPRQSRVTPPTWMFTASTEQPVMASTAPMTAFWAFSATSGMGAACRYS